jgi:hypothetical protein
MRGQGYGQGTYSAIEAGMSIIGDGSFLFESLASYYA